LDDPQGSNADCEAWYTMATKIDFDFVDRAVDKIDRVDSQLTTRSILSSARAS